jgi:hypothetical protein
LSTTPTYLIVEPFFAEELRIETNFLSGEIPPDLAGLSNAGELGLYEILSFRIRKLLSSNPLFFFQNSYPYEKMDF